MEQLQALQTAYAPLGLLVARHLGDGRMEIAPNQLPAWCEKLGKPEAEQHFQLEDTFPYLTIFLEDAQAWWSEQAETLTRSGVWEETSLHTENSLQLDAAAFTYGDMPLLLIGPYYFDPNRLQKILQRAREMHLDHEALEKAQRALQRVESSQRQILSAMPDLYAIFDREGHVLHHNHKELPLPPKKAKEGQLQLSQVIGEDVARQVLEAAFHTVRSEQSVLELRREVGASLRIYEVRLVTMDEDTRMCLLRDVSEARELENRKAEFLSVAGHELRTPLTSIKGGLKMVVSQFNDQLPAPAQKLLTIASRNSERLVTLVNDLLNLQRIELSTRSFDRSPVSAHSIALRALEDNQPFAVELGRHLEKNDWDEDATVLADTEAILQVLTNLISNAVKFSPKEELITVSFTQDLDSVTFSIIDRGPGIPASHQEQLFQKFVRIPGSEQAPIKGTGLGLSICKAIVDAHMGSIGFQSEEGVGSTFFVRLAKTPAQAKEEE